MQYLLFLSTRLLPISIFLEVKYFGERVFREEEMIKEDGRNWQDYDDNLWTLALHANAVLIELVPGHRVSPPSITTLFGETECRSSPTRREQRECGLSIRPIVAREIDAVAWVM